VKRILRERTGIVEAKETSVKMLREGTETAGREIIMGKLARFYYTSGILWRESSMNVDGYKKSGSDVIKGLPPECDG